MKTEQKITERLEQLVEKAGTAQDSGDAMRFSQAACNLANTLSVIKNLKA